MCQSQWGYRQCHILHKNLKNESLVVIIFMICSILELLAHPILTRYECKVCHPQINSWLHVTAYNIESLGTLNTKILK